MIYHIQKDSWSLDAQNPPKNVWLLKLLFVKEAFDPVRSYEIYDEYDEIKKLQKMWYCDAVLDVQVPNAI